MYLVGLGAATLAAHTVVKNIVDYANNIFGTFSTVAQSLVASELGKVSAHRIHCFVGMLLMMFLFWIFLKLSHVGLHIGHLKQQHSQACSLMVPCCLNRALLASLGP